MTTKDIASALRASEQNVTQNWPLIEAAFSSLGVDSRNILIAAAATVSVECPSWKPQTEKYNGDPLEYFKRYDGRKDLGNIHPDDGYRFRGRGFIQITGRANYAYFGGRLGRDLVGHPDDALIPRVCASILAFYFADRGVNSAASAGNWILVRRLVNGGNNGLSDFLEKISTLQHLFL